MSSLASYTYANSGTSYYALKSESASNWSTYPAVSAVDLSGNAITNISSLQIDAQILTADASDLLLNGIPIATITNISNVADWAMFPAVANVAMNGFELSGAGAGSFTSLSVSGVPTIGSASQWATFGAVTDINVSGNAVNNAASVQVGGRTLTTQAGTASAPYLLINGSNVLSNWSSFTANSAVGMGMNDINNAKDITASGTILGGAMNTTTSITISSQVLTTDPTTLFLNGTPIASTIAPIVSNWANYPAVANVNLNGNSITSATDITLDASTGNKVILKPNANVSNDLEVGHDLQVQGNIGITSGGISQCNVVGSGVTNFFTAATTFGDITDLGYAEVKGANRPAGFSSFVVNGGVTFDGGTVHGFKCTTAGAGIFGLARFELTPLLIYIASAGPITLASITYTIISALLNVRVSAGTFVVIEHGNLGGYDGIYIQNTLNNSGDTRVIWTAGGTQYNTGVVQTSNLFTPQPIQFWSNVYNPSTGSVPNAPTNSFGQSINPIAYTDVNRANAILGNVDGWFNSKGVYDPSPNPVYSNFSTFSNTTLIGSFGGVVGNNGSTPYNFGSSSVHIGIQQISATYVGNPNPTILGDRMVAIGTISNWGGTGYADNIVIGTHSNGINLSGSDNIAIGTNAGTNVGSTCIAVGLNSGQNITTPNVGTISIGNEAGEQVVGDDGIYLGFQAGSRAIGGDHVCIGYNAGATSRAASVSIGLQSGIGAGQNCVSIGANAGYAPVARDNCIAINATGSQLTPAQSNSCYINPVRSVQSSNAYQNSLMTYNATTAEVGYATSAYSLEVVATSGTAIALTPTLRGKTYVLTGTTTQSFTTTALGANDVAFFVVVHNGNATGGGDINLSGMTGTNIIHEQKSTQNGGSVYLYWTGTALVGY